MKSNYWTFLARLAFAALIYGAPSALAAATSPSLGAAGTYAVLAGSEVTNTGLTTITGDLGIYPGIGPLPHFHDNGTVTFIGGVVHDADTFAQNAMADKDTAYGLLDQTCDTSYAGTKDLAGLTLVPGVYCAGSFHLTGTLTLSGVATDTWIFKSASDLVMTGGAPVNVISPSCNVWWRVVSTASFDAGSSLVGNILADTSITLAAGASLSGRAFARTAEVTLSSNAITPCILGVITPTPTPTSTPSPTATPTFALAVVPTLSGSGIFAFIGLLALVAFAVLRRTI
jgi:Ice-binding-like